MAPRTTTPDLAPDVTPPPPCTLSSSVKHNLGGDDPDTSNNNDDSSIDTIEAMNEMLGLPSHFSACDVKDPESEEPCMSQPHENRIMDESSPNVASPPPVERIHLPPNVSRHRYPSQSCTAFLVPNFLTQSECDTLIASAASKSSSSSGGGGFRYITEATHTSPDGGTKLMVQIQNPNPHKLSAILPCETMVSELYQRIESRCGNFLEEYCERCTYRRRRLRHQSSCQGSSSSRCDGSNVHYQSDTMAVVQPQGLNPKFRILRYDASDDDRFDPHYDATTYVPSPDGKMMQSHLTVLIYLNDGDGEDFDGGETLFLDSTIESTTKSCRRRGSEEAEDENGKRRGDRPVKVTPRTGTCVIFEHDLYHAGSRLEWGTKYVLRTDILFDSVVGISLDGEIDDDCAYDERMTGGEGDVVARLQEEKKAAVEGIEATERKENVDCEGRMPNIELETKEEGTPVSPSCKTVSTLAEELNLPPELRCALYELGVWNGTVEAFCSPGEVVVQMMLHDLLCCGGGDEEDVDNLLLVMDRFVKEAFDSLKEGRD